MTRAHWLLLLFLLAAIAAYASGLPGTFLLDDHANFADLLRYTRGEIEWPGVVLGNGSGPLGRPVSMASFAFTTACCGYSPLALKAGSIALHFLNGALVALLVRELLRACAATDRNAEIWAVAIACWWLVLPIHVGTVLYAVQRMTVLCATFTLLALLSFCRARAHAAAGNPRAALGYWVAMAVSTALAALAKENGALAPLLCAVAEFCVFRRLGPTPRSARVVLGLTVGVPALVFVFAVATNPELVLAGYDVRSFTLTERLLTEPRVLWQYVGSILMPFGPRMGLLQDDVVVSSTLLMPPTTLIAVAAWVVLAVAAVAGRRINPLASAGVAFFLAGHALESTVFPLELKFEHRNYLPALGVLLAVAGLARAAQHRLPAPTPQFRVAMPIIAVAAASALLFATHSRALVWRSEDTLLAQAVAHRSLSPRLNATLAARLMLAGATESAIGQFEVAARSLPRRESGVRHLWVFLAHCYAGRVAPDAVFVDLATDPPALLSAVGVQAVTYAVEAVESGRCPASVAPRLSHALTAWLDANVQPAAALGAWRLRYQLGRLLAAQGRYAEAASLLDAAWRDSGRATGVGIVLFQVHASAGDRAAARRVVEKLETTTPDWDLQARDAIARFRAYVDEPAVSSGSSPEGSGYPPDSH